MKQRIPLLLALAVILLSACRNPMREPVRLSGTAQGSYYSIIYYDSLGRDFQPQMDSIFLHFDSSASLWVEQSLLRRINANETQQLDSILLNLYQMSRSIYDYSYGAFDITVGKLVNAWGFGFEHRAEMTDAVIDSLRQYTGFSTLQLSADSLGRPTIVKQHPETQLDFNAIAQGYVVDLIAQYFDRQGIHRYLIDVGGEVRSSGTKPDGKPWVVGIERPADNKYSAPEVETSIALTDMSVVTSGNYRKYYENNGVKYSHTINPATGRPVEHSLLSVTVIDRYAWRADALCTMFMVMGLEQSLRFIDDHPDDPMVQAVFFIYNQDGEYRTFATSQFEQYLTDQQHQ